MSARRRQPLADRDTVRRLRWRVCFFLASALAISWLFGGVLIGREALGFRDVWHFYQPLYGWLGQWWPGNTPRWNPLDQTGLPVLGEATSACLYPPRWIFACALPSEVAMGGYVVGHLLMAAAGCWWLARVHGAGSAAAAYAGWAYAASGGVFFLYTNPPFLVGASWLPWMVGAMRAAARLGGWRRLTAAAGTLAAVVLGGDPQSAVHGVLVAGGLWFSGAGGVASAAAEGDNSGPTQHSRSRISRRSARWGSGVARMALAGAIAFGLAAPQVLAGWQWAAQSFRSATAPPHAIGLLLQSFRGGHPAKTAGWWALVERPGSQTHAAAVYDFSVSPWHAGQLLLPTMSGRLAGVHERWMDALPGEGRIWAPTIYCGMVASVFWLCGLFQRGGKSPWWWLAVVAWLLVLGRFGAGYVVRTLWYWCTGESQLAISDATGGPYWWLVSLLPGYGGFRYPAKWLPVLSLGLVMHAALMLPHGRQLWSERRVRLCRRICLAVVGVALLAAVLTALPWVGQWFDQLGHRPELFDRFWGPLDAAAARRAIWIASLQAGLAAAVIAMGVVRRARTARLLLMLTMLEMCWLAHWQLHRVPVAAARPARLATGAGEIGGLRDAGCAASLLIDEAASRWPSRWRETPAGPGRLREVMAAQRQTYFGRWHLADRLQVFNAGVSIAPLESELFWREYWRRTRTVAGDRDATARRLRASVAGLLGATRVVARQPGGVSRDVALRGWAADQDRREAASGSAPADAVFFSDQFRVVDRPDDAEGLGQWMQDWFDELSRPGSAATVVWRGEATAAALAWGSASGDHVGRPGEAGREMGESDPAAGGRAAAPCRVVLCDCEQFEVEVQAASMGLVALMRFQDGCWRARVRPVSGGGWRALSVHQVNVLGQGVFVPPGHWRVRFEYAPSWWRPAVLVAVVTWLLVIGLWMGVLVRGSRGRPGGAPSRVSRGRSAARHVFQPKRRTKIW